jgi:hypothetical protein
MESEGRLMLRAWWSNRVDQRTQAIENLTSALKGHTAALAGMTGAPRRSRSWIGRLVAGTTVVAAIGSAAFTGAQAALLGVQIEQSNALRNATILGAAGVEGDGGIVTVSNRSDVRFDVIGFWVIGDNEENSIVEVIGGASSVAACSTLSVDLSDHLDGHGITEAMTAIRLPSREWYLISAGGRSSPVGYSGDDAVSAIRASDLYQAAADTYWEGANAVDAVELDGLVVANAARTGLSPAPASVEMLPLC